MLPALLPLYLLVLMRAVVDFLGVMQAITRYTVQKKRTKVMKRLVAATRLAAGPGGGGGKK
jgi:hypothetical protein